MINNYLMAHCHTRPQSDDEQGINKLQAYFKVFSLSRYCIYLIKQKCIDGAVIMFQSCYYIPPQKM